MHACMHAGDRVCRELIPSCHVCTLPTSAGETATCTLCRDGKYLHQGACIDTCDAIPAYRNEGRGNYGLRCVTLPLCEAGTYEDTPPAPSNVTRTCVPVSDCDAGRVELAPPTATSNRICIPMALACGDHEGTYARAIYIC